MKSELRALLERVVETAPREPDALVPDIENRHAPFPLGDMQHAYWIGRSAAYASGNVAIHGYLEVDCVGLDLGRLERAWQALVRRHDMLRAVVGSDGLQQILEEVPAYAVALTDLSSLPEDARTAELARLRAALDHEIRPLDQWPVFDIRASRLDARTTRLHLSIDATHVDLGSFFILFDELARLYRDPALVLPKLTLSFRDYILAERAVAETPAHARALAYWRERVAELPPAPELPLACDPATTVEPRFQRRGALLEPSVWTALRGQAARHGVTPSAALAAAYSETLGAWATARPFTLNVTRFQRLPLHAEVDDIVGDFTSMLLLPAADPVEPTFAHRARRLNEQLWRDLEHGVVSGVEILRELAKVRGRQRGAAAPYVFTSALGMAPGRSPRALRALGDITYAITQTPQVWLDHQVFEEDGELHLVWDAIESLFRPGLLDDMFAAYQRLLRALAEGSAWGDEGFDFMSERERAVVAAMNGTATPCPETSLFDLFRARVAAAPDAVALIDGRRTLDYRTLEALASSLGHQFAACGARPGSRVAIIIEKSAEQIGAVLGAIAAGAAYVPIDPQLPEVRILGLLADSQASVIAASVEIAGKVRWPEGVPVVIVDGSIDTRALWSPPAVAPGELAYILYTSGSTGDPKGVMIEHRAVVNRVLDVNERFGIGARDRVIAVSALHHDLSVYDLFGGLAAGATLIVPDAERVRDPAHLADLCRRHGVTVWNSVPAYLGLLVEYLEHAPADRVAAESLRYALIAGDFIPLDLPDRARALAPRLTFMSLGGPTETTVWDICYPVGAVDPAWTSIPYGRPMANASYHVRDDQGRPRPTWAEGELWIGGVGLGRGYWRDEARTRERFVLDKWTGERLYRSGDLGRRWPDGTIEILGRKDLQVKIQGQRIELGEIESALTRDRRVRAAVALVVGERHGPRELVACVVPATADATPTPFEMAFGKTMAIRDHAARVAFKQERRDLRTLPGHTRVPLEEVAIGEPLAGLLAARRSERSFAEEPLERAALVRLLGVLREVSVDGVPRRNYASGGSLYPVQVHVAVRPDRVRGLEGGLYYYDPRGHELVLLSRDLEWDPRLHVGHNRGPFTSAAFAFYFVSEPGAVTPLYGGLADPFALLEAGYMGQLLMLAAPGCGLGLCAIGALDFERISAAFELGSDQRLVHSMIGGVPAPAPTDLASALRSAVARRLPSHMVPARVLVLDAVPLTGNGKVDRRALAERAAASPRTPKTVTAPRDETERQLAEIIQAVIASGPIGVDENFFDLGATSLHLVQIHARIKQTFQRDLAIVDLFKYPTLGALAAMLAGAATSDGSAAAQDRADQRRDALRARQSRRRPASGQDDDGER